MNSGGAADLLGAPKRMESAALTRKRALAPAPARGENRSGRTLGLEGGEGDRLLRLAIGPHHELKRLVEGLAGGDRRSDHRAALRVARRRPASQTQRVAEHDEVLSAPQVEMADPQLLVDELGELGDRRPLARGRLQVERAADIDRKSTRLNSS